ncbi:hypothetical protein [Seleniivibrio sp.]|uniref:hypothetical protein n=1 Tax=Seleniivibrio sp. TaxID=2898801 RepID=UPI0025E48E07|nr:hypothetical protein [Seleniivibrio sp.]MCD8554298.1 hypothetical protein [Seleniivibrio sp.]
MSGYPYTERDLLIEPEKYSFCDCSAPDFLDSYRENRAEAIRKIEVLCGKLPEEAPKADVFDMTLLKRFEISKRLDKADYDNDIKLITSASYALSARCLSVGKPELLICFNTLLKMNDSLISAAYERLSGEQLILFAFSLMNELKIFEELVNENH